jgi:hypothetical protein
LGIAVPEHTLTNPYHAAVWIDRQRARVFHFNATDVDEMVVQPEHPTRHIHHKANSIGSGHTSEDHAFFQDVISAIGTASAILVAGPANAKTEFVKHIHRHNSQLIERIAAVETSTIPPMVHSSPTPAVISGLPAECARSGLEVGPVHPRSAISISDARFAQEFAPHGFSSVTLDRNGSFLSADLRRGCGNCVVSRNIRGGGWSWRRCGRNCGRKVSDAKSARGWRLNPVRG